MNKKGQEEILFILMAVVVIVLVVIGVMYLIKWSNDKTQKTNCDNLEKNGYNVRMEIADVLGPNVLDCFVENSPGKYVPYDRFRGTE